MNSNQILQSDVLDILFENKNKYYGAYELRRFYAGRLRKAILATMGVLIILTLLSFLTKKPDNGKFRIDQDIFLAPPAKEAIKKKDDKPIKENPAKKDKSTPPTQKAPTRLTITNNPVVDSILTIDPGIDLGPVTRPGDGGEPVVNPRDGDGPPQNITVKPPVAATPSFDPQIPVESPDVYPEFPGGNEALIRFMERHLKNPADMEEGESVVVHVKFVVGPDGKLRSFEVVKDGGEIYNKEVLRVVKKMPDWRPGRSNGRDVAVFKILPVRFTAAE